MKKSENLIERYTSWDVDRIITTQRLIGFFELGVATIFMFILIAAPQTSVGLTENLIVGVTIAVLLYHADARFKYIERKKRMHQYVAE